MSSLPNYVSITFIAITFVSVLLFYRATNNNKLALLIVLVVAAVQAILSYKGFYLDTSAVPPRLLFILLPSLIIMVIAFVTRSGKTFIDGINLKIYTYLHSVRVVVEVVILWLFIHELMPQSMTFEGRNFDILSGLTAPLIAYFGFTKKTIAKKYIILWNVICLLLVLQVVITGILSAPFEFQQMAFDQPNTGILYFPFIWLPSIVVPIVIFGHIVAISRLIKGAE